MPVRALLAAAAVAALSLTTAACGSSSKHALGTLPHLPRGTHYPTEVRVQFLQSCAAEANIVSSEAPTTLAAYCRCSLAFLEAHLPYKEMARASKAIVELKAAPPTAQAAFAAGRASCAKRVLGKVAKTFR